MHTTPNPIVPNHKPTLQLEDQLREAKAESQLVMERVQTKALETLEALMDEAEPTGDAKKDAIVARERNRRRLAATQALTHIRSIQRQQRTGAKARAKAAKHKEKPQMVPLAACPPVPGRENLSNAETPPKGNNAPPPPESPAPNPPEAHTGRFHSLDLQQDWLRERRQAMTKARAKRKAKNRGKR